ncbi:MAG: alginate export family protein [Myxococcota bacterium]
MEGLLASGDDDPTDADQRAWNQLFPTAHKFLGVADIIGARSNVASVVAHGKLRFADHFHLLVDVHAFFRPEPTATSAGTTGYTGAEIDASLRWRVAGGLFAWASYALFLPDDDFYVSDGVAHFAELWFGYQLGPRYD